MNLRYAHVAPPLILTVRFITELSVFPFSYNTLKSNEKHEKNETWNYSKRDVNTIKPRNFCFYGQYWKIF